MIKAEKFLGPQNFEWKFKHYLDHTQWSIKMYIQWIRKDLGHDITKMAYEMLREDLDRRNNQVTRLNNLKKSNLKIGANNQLELF